ncbi:SRPBCC domain-containing protein [Variovorax sp. J2P1-59]|uniref:SRPBCC family protein n=1 Tax=Variovorax flavidus TaxID=3053501 RepID=UPI002577B344|nr:SRPBCC domain-containing protein [Variovorax sp. J2P1-59]MDM0078095.1 SRPBCC domain-containing protein [Variovorax sp. J2P1-59]
MKVDVQFDFLVDKEKNTITTKRTFAAKRQLVWDCYTKSELLDRWFAPKPLTTKTKFMDFREGGYWHYAMVEPNGQEYWGRMDYQTIQPIDSYTSLDGFCDDTGALNPALPRSKWNVTFSDAGTHTLVETVVSYASAEALQQVMQMGLKEGLTSTLERLDELLLDLN